MPGVDVDALLAASDVGEEMHALMAELYPICRSLTGDGVRETLAILQREVPLEITEIPSGTQVFDWTLPREWNIHDAWVTSPDGTRVVDFRRSNLHLLGYSIPIRRRLPLGQLREHLFTHPENADWIPFRTSYYDENWGFCLSQSQLEQLPDGEYEVVIDSSLTDGYVTYAEGYVAGRDGRRGALFDVRSATRRSATTTSRGSCSRPRSPSICGHCASTTPTGSYSGRARSGRSAGSGRTRRASAVSARASSSPAPATRGR